MASIRATVEVPLGIEAVYGYLRNRYEGKIYLAACSAAVGYIPSITCLEVTENQSVSFHVRSRLRLSSWTWGYELEALGQECTKVTIWYKWRLLSELFTMGTTRQQAGNEIAQTALALEALSQRAS